MGIKYGRGWGGARISLSRGSVLSPEYFPSSYYYYQQHRNCRRRRHLSLGNGAWSVLYNNIIDTARIVCAAGSSLRPSFRLSFLRSTASTTAGKFAAERRRLEQITIDSCACRVAGSSMRVASCRVTMEEVQHRLVITAACYKTNKQSAVGRESRSCRPRYHLC